MKIFSENTAIDYRPAELCDLPQIKRLEDACFKEEAWSADSIEKDLKCKRSVWFAAFADERLVGYTAGNRVCGEGEVNRIAVDLSFRRTGIGKRLLEMLLCELERTDCGSIFLEVRIGNTGAIGLYKSAGFEICGERKNYYKCPVEDAALMLLRRE